jgi:GNAT superfamily N-acetyltransferase
VNIRPFESRDYERIAAIAKSVSGSERPGDADWYRRRDASLDAKIRNLRLVGEADGTVVAWGDLFNTWWMYHPRKFRMRLLVDTPWQSQRIGSAIYSRLVENAESNWSPLLINTEVRETHPRCVSFLQHRGFEEVARRWEAALRVEDAPLDSLPGAVESLQAQGIRIATMAEERARRGDATFNHQLFELEQLIYVDEPGHDPEGTIQFEGFVANELDPDVFLEDASFVAVDGAHMVALSRIERDHSALHRLHVGFTGTHPDYRGRGIARALKLCTVEHARAHGYTEMATTNDSSNAAMLHINAALGFQRLPAWIVFEKKYSAVPSPFGRGLG